MSHKYGYVIGNMEQVVETSTAIIRRADHRRKPGAPQQNLNAVSSLLYVQNVEARVDRRSTLGKGLQFHRRRILDLFGCSFDVLNAIEAERVRRLVWLTTVRELSASRLSVAVAAQDAVAYTEAEKRFLAVSIAEERAERLVVESANARKASKPGLSLHDRLKASANVVTTPRHVDAPAPVLAKPEPFQIEVSEDEPQVVESDGVLRVVEPVPSPPITGDWSCAMCGTKVFNVPKPKLCERCRRSSRFKSLSGGPLDAA